MLTETAEKWLAERGLDAEVASRLGFDSVKSGAHGEEVSIPYVVRGEVVNHKYRTIGKKAFRQDKGGQQVLWNFDCLLDPTLQNTPLIVTEGELDALAAIQAGYPRTVSVPGGAPSEAISEASSKKYAYLEHARVLLDPIQEIILAVDSDGPGAALLTDLSIRLGRHRIKFLRYPKGCKDLNDALRLYGARGVVETIQRAQYIAVPGLFTSDELPPFERRIAYSTGFHPLDPHFRVRMGDLSVWTGIPGHGKTTLNNFVTFGLAREHGFKVCVASFEQHPQADHIPALLNLYLGRPVQDHKDGRFLCSDQELAEARRFVAQHYLFMVPTEDDTPDLDWVMDIITVAVKRHNARIVVIDPWNEIDHARPGDMSLTEYVGYAVKQFKRLARVLDCHIMIVAHPTKMEPGKVPGLYAISDSAHWANKPDAGIVVHKPHIDSDIVEVHVTKSRYWDQIGKPGALRLRFNAVTRTYESIAWPAEESD